jgi:hypothetical protein
MDDQFNPQDPPAPNVTWTVPADPYESERRAQEVWRRQLRRRLLILLCAICAAFAVTTWLLVRSDNPLGLFRLASGPTNVVRAQLEALNRGDLRGAYDLFSARYRRDVSFDAFHQLVITHRGVFQTQQIRIGRDDESASRAIVVTHLVAESGKRYVARFTLVQTEGRWWVDDLRWGSDRDPEDREKLRA